MHRETGNNFFFQLKKDKEKFWQHPNCTFGVMMNVSDYTYIGYTDGWGNSLPPTVSPNRFFLKNYICIAQYIAFNLETVSHIFKV